MDVKMDSTGMEMSTCPPVRLLLRYAVPSVLTMIVSSLYTIIDKIFVGNGIGYLGISAVTVSVSLVSLITAVYSMIGTGAGTLFAMELGKGENGNVKKVAAAAVGMQVIAGILISASGLCFLRPLCIIAGAGEDSLPYVMDYMRIIFSGSTLPCLGIGLTSIIRSQGKPRLAMVLSIMGSVINCVLDPIFIFIFDMGIKGAALATIMSQGVTAVCVLICIFRSEYNGKRIKPLDFKGTGLQVKSSLKIGFPSFLMSFLTAILVAVFSNTLQYYGDLGSIGGDVAVSSLGLSTTIGDIIMTVSVGVQQGIAPLIAFNYSAKLYGRTRQLFWTAFFGLTVILILFWAIVELFPGFLINLFGEAANMEFAVFTVRVYNLALPAMSFQMLGGMLMQSTGQVKRATVVSLSRNVFFGIPLLIIIPLFFGVYGAMATGPLSDLGGCAVSAVMVFKTMGNIKRLETETASEQVSIPVSEE